MSDTRLVIEIKNTRLVELLDYSESMIALGSLYNRHLSRNPQLVHGEDAKLYIKEIRSGSIITELMDLIPLTLPFVEYSNNIVDFTRNLKALYYFMSGKQEKIEPLSQSLIEAADVIDYKNAQRFLNPVARDHGAQLNVGTMNVNAPVTINFNLSSMESNAAQNQLQRFIDVARAPRQNSFSNVVFVWHVAKNDITSQSGDRGTISTISDRPCKVIFETQGLKEAMMMMSENPLQKAFVVDVEVSYVEDKSIAYKVLNLHDHFNI